MPPFIIGFIIPLNMGFPFMGGKPPPFIPPFIIGFIIGIPIGIPMLGMPIPMGFIPPNGIPMGGMLGIPIIPLGPFMNCCCCCCCCIAACSSCCIFCCMALGALGILGFSRSSSAGRFFEMGCCGTDPSVAEVRSVVKELWVLADVVAVSAWDC